MPAMLTPAVAHESGHDVRQPLLQVRESTGHDRQGRRRPGKFHGGVDGPRHVDERILGRLVTRHSEGSTPDAARGGSSTGCPPSRTEVDAEHLEQLRHVRPQRNRRRWNGRRRARLSRRLPDGAARRRTPTGGHRRPGRGPQHECARWLSAGNRRARRAVPGHRVARVGGSRGTPSRPRGRTLPPAPPGAAA